MPIERIDAPSFRVGIGYSGPVVVEIGADQGIAALDVAVQVGQRALVPCAQRVRSVSELSSSSTLSEASFVTSTACGSMSTP